MASHPHHHHHPLMAPFHQLPWHRMAPYRMFEALAFPRGWGRSQITCWYLLRQSVNFLRYFRAYFVEYENSQWPSQFSFLSYCLPGLQVAVVWIHPSRTKGKHPFLVNDIADNQDDIQDTNKSDKPCFVEGGTRMNSPLFARLSSKRDMEVCFGPGIKSCCLKFCKVVAQWMQHPQPPYSHGEGSSTRWGSMHQIWERRLSPLLLLTYPALAAENHRLSHTFPC